MWTPRAMLLLIRSSLDRYLGYVDILGTFGFVSRKNLCYFSNGKCIQIISFMFILLQGSPQCFGQWLFGQKCWYCMEYFYIQDV